jgi:hypothetical protein
MEEGILDTFSRSIGLIINSAKKVIRMNTTNEHKITINGSDIRKLTLLSTLVQLLAKKEGRIKR